MGWTAEAFSRAQSLSRAPGACHRAGVSRDDDTPELPRHKPRCHVPGITRTDNILIYTTRSRDEKSESISFAPLSAPNRSHWNGRFPGMLEWAKEESDMGRWYSLRELRLLGMGGPLLLLKQQYRKALRRASP